MKWWVRLILIAVIAYWGLSSYKLVIGTKTVFGNQDDAALTKLANLLTLQNVYYYENPFDDNYVVIIETSEKIYISTTSAAGIAVFKTANLITFSNYFKEIKPIPWWIFGILLLAVLIIGRKHKHV